MYSCIYRLLEERLKAMLTSLPLVSDLHHPAMRERHWKQLMKVGYALLRCACTCKLQHASCCCVCCPCNLKAASLLVTAILRQPVSVTLRLLFLCVFMGQHAQLDRTLLKFTLA